MVGFEAMKEEAVKRMKKLELHSDCIAAFEHDNQVWESEFLGALFELNDEKKGLHKGNRRCLWLSCLSYYPYTNRFWHLFQYALCDYAY